MKASDTDTPLAIVCDGGAVLVSITSNGSLNQKNFPKGPSEFTFDDNHIAGEFRFSERDSFASVGSATAAPDTLVTGTFGYKNPKRG